MLTDRRRKRRRIFKSWVYLADCLIGNTRDHEILVFDARQKPVYPEENLLEKSREPKNSPHSIVESNPGQIGGRQALRVSQGFLGNVRTKEKYHREHEPVLGNTGTTINLYKFSLRREVHGGGLMRKAVAVLNREQMRKNCRNMETEGNFGREEGPPSSGDLQCSAPTLLKGNLYISTSAGLGNEGFPSD